MSAKQREDLTGEHTIGDAGQLVLAVLFFGVWIVDSFLLNYTTIFAGHVTAFTRITVGSLLTLSSMAMAVKSISIVFGEVRGTPGVIRKSLYNLVRHPMYLGEILLYLGLSVFTFSLASFAITIITFIFLHYISRYEERLLLDRFGEDYRKYMSEVPMWFPKLGGRMIKQV